MFCAAAARVMCHSNLRPVSFIFKCHHQVYVSQRTDKIDVSSIREVKAAYSERGGWIFSSFRNTRFKTGLDGQPSLTKGVEGMTGIQTGHPLSSKYQIL